MSESSALPYRRAVPAIALFMAFGKGVGYVRFLLAAAYFGLSRAMDFYFMGFAMSLLIVQPVGAWFDQVVVPRLVRAREDPEKSGFKDLAGIILTLSLILAIVLGLLFLALLPVLAACMATGFSALERVQLTQLAWFFLPWVMLYCPYAAVGAVYKSLRLYRTVLAADLVISVTGTVAFFLWHPGVKALPVTLALGHAAAIVFLLANGRLPRPRMIRSDSLRPLVRNFMELTGVSQLGSLTTVIDRFFQSFLPVGSIAGMAFAQQTILPLNEVAALKELYIVPLSSGEDRAGKLQRLLEAGIMLTTPIAVFLAFHSRGIVALLYERGAFDPAAGAVTASVFAILSVSLITGAVTTPLMRTFQIVDRIRYTGIIYLALCFFLLIGNAISVFVLNAGVQGLAAVSVAASVGVAAVEILLLRRIDLRISLSSLFSCLALVLILCLPAGWLSTRLTMLPTPLLQVVAALVVYGLIVGAGAFVARRRILRVAGFTS